ncbi:MAG: dihydroneopterin aldolase [Firmicutes bacterium]|nr:dihydroneopterin aldolase [Bacillota bacterium]
MDKINMKNLSFYGYHGAMTEENVLGQKFVIDCSLLVDLSDAGKSDDVFDTVHYGEAFDLIKNVVENERYNLIEALAYNIIEKLMESFPKINGVDIEVKKPQAPVPGIYDYFSVSLSRRR